MKRGKIDSFFEVKRRQRSSEEISRWLLCRGNINQGQLEGGGKQCVCIAVCFLAMAIPKASEEVDKLLEIGTNLFNSISSRNDYLMINEIPKNLTIDGNFHTIYMQEPKSGMLSYSVDDLDSLKFTLESATRQCFEDSNSCTVTIGDAPGSTIGIRKDNGIYTICDSHSRDDTGRCTSDNSAVIIQCSSINGLMTYLRDMSGSLSTRDQPFEITPISISRHAGGGASSSSRQSTTESRYGDKSDSYRTSRENLETSHIFQKESFHEQSSRKEHLADICKTDDSSSDQDKFFLIMNRKPHDKFQFPSKIYRDKRRSKGEMKRYCQHDWFQTFDFIGYSEIEDGIYCIACRLFPDTSHRRAKKFISEAYNNWKDAITDLKSHAVTEYHLSSVSRMKAFINTYKDPSNRIDVSVSQHASQAMERNRKVLSSIIKSLIFCGRQGISLRGHRDDDSEKCEVFSQGNFKELLTFRVDAGDEILSHHLKTCKKNAKYTSKTCQNDLLLCIKEYIQSEIVKEVNQQKFGPLFGIQCDEVTDSSNWEQLGIVLRYTKDNIQVERLLEFVPCESTTGEAICENIITALTSVRLDVQNCRSQTMDGAANMSGKYKGCAARFQNAAPKATYHYCSSHDLNLVLCKSCQVREIHLMLDSLQQIGIFFKYSPKRSRRLEKSVESINMRRSPADRITATKVKVFCETRWVEKITTLQDFHSLYEPLLHCLDAIGVTERDWDGKSVSDAYGLLKRIRDSTFIASFQTVLHFFGYMFGISKKLQGTEMDVIQAYNMVELVKETIHSARSDEGDFDSVFARSEEMATLAGITIEIPRRCGLQKNRSNVPAANAKEYFKRSVFIPFVDSLIQQLDMRFNTLTKQAIRGFYLLPANLTNLTDEIASTTFDFYKTDLPSCSTFNQEMLLWKRLWSNDESNPDTISSTLMNSKTCPIMFPNITKILYLLQLVAVTSSGVERGNSYLKIIKRAQRSTMVEDRLNALLLLYIHKDIHIDIAMVIDMYARRHPRRMLLINPLSCD